jgi:hypothetical protein
MITIIKDKSRCVTFSLVSTLPNFNKDKHFNTHSNFVTA